MSKFTFTLLTNEYIPDVRALLLNSFFLHEPLNERFGYNLPDEVEDFIDDVVKCALRDQCSFVALDGNQLAGMALNTICQKNDASKANKYQSASLQYIFTMLGLLHQAKNVYDHFNVDRILYTAVISVDPNYRGQRLSEQLLEKSLEYAKESLHLQAAYTETSSYYSLKAFLKMNYERLYEIMYETYDKEKLSNMGVHDRCTLVGRKL
ncbi:unnamed protein product [Adineta ricciae]|uniref:aralkylamine N-acetyltransferase n=1 Tax=Adineta ricciae TaxID=249248 RepID=A0A813P5E2_ADIRI|nr:unnamed protein product [Adineta ricciae]